MELVDIGANLAHDSFDDDRDAVLARARAAGVTRIVVTGSCLPSSHTALQLAIAHPQMLYATAGLHPHHARDFSDRHIDEFRALAAHSSLVAIGETGLDYFRNFSPPADQKRSFLAHLELAAELQMPLFLHQRDAHEDFLPMIRDHRANLGAVVVHCFTGTEAELEDYLDLDLHIGLTGWICDERRGHHMHAYLHRIPAERLMIESDAPYLLPRNLTPKPRTRRNEPVWLTAVAEQLAEVRSTSPDDIARTTTLTACNFFGLPES